MNTNRGIINTVEEGSGLNAGINVGPNFTIISSRITFTFVVAKI